MLAPALALLLGHQTSSVPVWRSYEEVFDLRAVDGIPYAATNGGLLRRDPSGWIATPSPAAIREIEGTDPLVVKLADGQSLWRKGDKWEPVPSYAMRMIRPATQRLILPDPPKQEYARIDLEDRSYAGTIDGLYVYCDEKWTRETLPTSLPVARPNGIALLGGRYVVGGLGGLYIGRPGDWKEIAGDSIRQIRAVGAAVWCVHGNGAVDKIDIATDRVYPDVLTGSSRRPWTSAIGEVEGAMLLGGSGGWSERGSHAAERFPPELAGDVVTAISGERKVRWLGTQKSGLFRYSENGFHRWNPGNGLPDTWITALCPTPRGMLAGTSHFGLYRVVNGRIRPFPGPSRRVTALVTWRGRLVVGGMEGAWISDGKGWKPLPTNEEETTSLTVTGNALLVTTSSGVYHLLP